MTNEERLEGRLIDAHRRGYYDKVIEKINELKQTHPKSTPFLRRSTRTRKGHTLFFHHSSKK